MAPVADVGRSTVLLLGTEHFVTRRDIYRPTLKDMLSPENQQEIREVVDRVLAFRPTRVAIEHGSEEMALVSRQYADYRRGRFELSADETHQIAFRVAAGVGLDSIDPINAWGREYKGAAYEDLEVWARAHGQGELYDKVSSRIMERVRDLDPGTRPGTLRDRLRSLNSEALLAANLGIYMELCRIGTADDPIGADVISGWWYNRNLRIFRNLQALAERPGTRLFVLIGAGHVPILRQCVEAAWDLDLADVGAYL